MIKRHICAQSRRYICTYACMYTRILTGNRFKRYIEDSSSDLVADDKMRKLVLCTGKVYFDLLAAREAKGMNDVAIARLEQIAPFPSDKVQADIAKYSNAEVVWCQEEPKNAGERRE